MLEYLESHDPWRATASAPIQVNIGALVALTRAVVPGMVARKKGRVLNIVLASPGWLRPAGAAVVNKGSTVVAALTALAPVLRRGGESSPAIDRTP